MAEQTATEQELAAMLVEALNLDVEAGEIEPEEPLFGDGLGLDSIDALEIAMEVSRNYGIQLRSDDPDNARIFSSLRALAAHVDANRPG
jgi:acyl carrier protein